MPSRSPGDDAPLTGGGDEIVVPSLVQIEDREDRFLTRESAHTPLIVKVWTRLVVLIPRGTVYGCCFEGHQVNTTVAIVDNGGENRVAHDRGCQPYRTSIVHQQRQDERYKGHNAGNDLPALRVVIDRKSATAVLANPVVGPSARILMQVSRLNFLSTVRTGKHLITEAGRKGTISLQPDRLDRETCDGICQRSNDSVCRARLKAPAEGISAGAS